MKKGYRAYLLRLWQNDPGSPWYALVEDAHTGERRGFANLAELFDYLYEQTSATTVEPSPNPDCRRGPGPGERGGSR